MSPSEPTIDLSTIIVSWNTRDLLRECLASLEHETTSLAREVIVVDNDSSDDSVGMIRREFPNVVLIENRVNEGFPRANNQALDRCRGRYVLLLNPDTLVEPEAIRRMFQCLEADQSLGAAGCRLVRPDRSVQLECGRNFPTLWNVAFELMGLSRLFPRNRLTGHWRMTYWDHLDDRVVPCILGACMLIRRDVLDALGGLEEHTYLEDIDLCYRINRSGWKIQFVGSATIIHYGGVSTERAPGSASYHHYQLAWQALWLFFHRHHGRLSAAAFTAMVFLTTSPAAIGLWLSSRAGWPPSDQTLERLRKVAAIWRWSLGTATGPEVP
jgi:GT2 family glycosyltransferase